MMTAPARANLTTEEMADYLRMTPNALRVMRCRGKAPRAIKRGKRLLWPVKAAEEWERARTA